MEKAKVQMEIEQFFKKRVETDPKIQNAYLRVHSEKHGMDFQLAAGEEAVHPDQPFYIASTNEHKNGSCVNASKV